MKTVDTKSADAKSVADLSPRRRELFEALLREARTENPANGRTGIRPTPNADDYPLTAAQESLWVIDRLQPGNAAYNISLARRFRGPLSVEAMQASLNEVLRRHETLRTVFTNRDAKTVQIVLPDQTLDIDYKDLAEFPVEAREEEARRFALEATKRAFDLQRFPLLRVCLIRLDTEDHVLFLVIHHIISDGWSLSLFFREMASLYESMLEAKASPLSALPIQYRDYAVWERDQLEGGLFDQELAYWKHQLFDAPAYLDLPADRPRRDAHHRGGATHLKAIPPRVHEGLKSLSRTEGATLFMTLLAAFDILLYLYTSQDDVVIGSAAAGREN
ncbi:MAG: condensation domain-containing protein, partial [Blastocatellia bacterium]